MLGWEVTSRHGAFGQVAVFADLPFVVGFDQAGADQARMLHAQTRTEAQRPSGASSTRRQTRTKLRTNDARSRQTEPDVPRHQSRSDLR